MGIFSRKKKIEDEKKGTGIPESKPVKAKVEVSGIDETGEQEVKKIKKQTSKKSGKTEIKKFEGVHDILLKPLLTEKISGLGRYNQYAFEVNPKANKLEIKKAVETYYNIKPIRVNIVNVRGKSVRWGRTRGKTRSWKKAIVTLRQGDKIELYEGV